MYSECSFLLRGARDKVYNVSLAFLCIFTYKHWYSGMCDLGLCTFVWWLWFVLYFLGVVLGGRWVAVVFQKKGSQDLSLDSYELFTVKQNLGFPVVCMDKLQSDLLAQIFFREAKIVTYFCDINLRLDLTLWQSQRVAFSVFQARIKEKTSGEERKSSGEEAFRLSQWGGCCICLLLIGSPTEAAGGSILIHKMFWTWKAQLLPWKMWCVFFLFCF